MGKIPALFLLLLLPGFVHFELSDKPGKKPFTARVIRIIDGDTMEVLYQHTPVKIRLAHIDCPEKRRSQPYGR